MSLFHRLLAVVLAFVLVLGGVLALSLALGYVSGATELAAVGRFFTSLTEATLAQRYWLATGGGLACLVGLLLLSLEMRASQRTGEIVIQRDKLGYVTVSLPGLGRLAEHTVGEIAGVEGIVSEAHPTRQGLVFRCRVAVDPEGSVPELTAEIRRRLNLAIGHHIGQRPARIEVRTRAGQSALARKRVR
jgi:hypothetical protein